MKKEIRVKLYCGENDMYVELWKVIEPEPNSIKYYGRYTYNNEGTWYYISDPLGYCELDHPVKNDVVFVVCDNDGKEYLRYSNADKNPLPTFENYMKEKWIEFKKNILVTDENEFSFRHWLLTFKDPDLYKKEIDEMYGYDENWFSCIHSSEKSYEPIPGTEFEYLGEKYQITKVKCKHDICGVEWYEYLCTDAPYVMEDFSWLHKAYVKNYRLLGRYFDVTKRGLVFSESQAIKLVESELMKIFPKDKDYSKLLYIKGIYCFEKTYYDVAKTLIGKELHHDKVLDLVKNLKEITKDVVFKKSRENKELIKKLYPDIYGYNYCLI